MFNIGQKTAVAGAFKLAGYDVPLTTLRIDDPTERIFVLGEADLAVLREVRTLEQVVGQILGCKAAIIAPREDLRPLVPFD